MLNKSISVVLPAYNEEGNVEYVIKTIINFFPSVTDNFEIIAVDDGSVDKTAEILEGLKKIDARLKVIRHPENRGYGAALTSGFKRAQKELVFMMDSDRQFDICDLIKLTAYIDDYDIVIGFRVKRKDPFNRSFYSYCFKSLIKSFFGIEFQDINCGFKLFKREVLQRMVIFTTGSLISAEIVIQAYINKLKIKQVAVNHYPRIYGRQTGASIKVILTILLEICRLKWRLRDFSYLYKS
jgi:glycosyltransferase involved in cell wall biosynthesis